MGPYLRMIEWLHPVELPEVLQIMLQNGILDPLVAHPRRFNFARTYSGLAFPSLVELPP